jgi:Ca2+-transporting ATPase
VESARNITFATIVFAELFRAFAARHPDRTFWAVGALSNVRLLVVVLGSGALQLALHHVPFAQRLFHIAPLSVRECALTIGLGLVPVTILETSKLARRIVRS